MKALQGLFPKQGVYYKYENLPKAGDDVDKIKISEIGPEREMATLVGTPIESPSPPKGKKLSLEETLIMNVREKRLYKTGQKLLSSSKNSELDFWNNSKTLDKNIEEFDIRRDLEQVTLSQAETLRRFFRPSVENHLEMIKALLVSESVFDAVYVERRDNLLRCNQGMRRFMGFLMERFQGEATVTTTASKELLRIEHCRMILAQPNNTPKGLGVQFEEHQALIAAQDSLEECNFDECYVRCRKLISYQNSLVVHACAEIILTQLRTKANFESSKDSLDFAEEVLERLRDGGELRSQWQLSWGIEIDGWMNVLKGIR